ncbi:hypothetical protein JZ751_021791 [Albula glossodonta]|uniref:Uncharacterized protein n=1 Tax=Albula glossodonta TaxID=121402 RepID=A0A8T2MS24_9TELE|nr:hypothetical protein JZ751_021791 [Albula glossodonta]
MPPAPPDRMGLEPETDPGRIMKAKITPMAEAIRVVTKKKSMAQPPSFPRALGSILAAPETRLHTTSGIMIIFSRRMRSSPGKPKPINTPIMTPATVRITRRLANIILFTFSDNSSWGFRWWPDTPLASVSPGSSSSAPDLAQSPPEFRKTLSCCWVTPPHRGGGGGGAGEADRASACELTGNRGTVQRSLRSVPVSNHIVSTNPNDFAYNSVRKVICGRTAGRLITMKLGASAPPLSLHSCARRVAGIGFCSSWREGAIPAGTLDRAR